LRAAAGVATAALVAPHRLFVAAVSVCNVVLGWDGWADLARQRPRRRRADQVADRDLRDQFEARGLDAHPQS
jgi:hypothetical protein